MIGLLIFGALAYLAFKDQDFFTSFFSSSSKREVVAPGAARDAIRVQREAEAGAARGTDISSGTEFSSTVTDKMVLPLQMSSPVSPTAVSPAIAAVDSLVYGRDGDSVPLSHAAAKTGVLQYWNTEAVPDEGPVKVMEGYSDAPSGTVQSGPSVSSPLTSPVPANPARLTSEPTSVAGISRFVYADPLPGVVTDAARAQALSLNEIEQGSERAYK